MITDPKSASELANYEFDIALAKRRAGNLPFFNRIAQIQSASANIDTEFGSADSQAFPFRRFVAEAKAVWALNTNPFVHMVFAAEQSEFARFTDFPGFAKNNVMGFRFRKEKLDQSSGWIYGVTQYSVPRLDNNRRSILVEGYGLLFEAPRRHVSRNFKNTTAKNIISTIVKRYGLGFRTEGVLEDRSIKEVEQNGDDLSLINSVVQTLNAFWYIDENALVLVGREHIHNQKPEIRFYYTTPARGDSLAEEFPISEFFPLLDGQFFEAGAFKITGRDVDLDSGRTVEQVFQPNVPRLGTLSLNSDQFFSNDGVTINETILKPSPVPGINESGVFLPLNTLSDDADRYRYAVEQKDIEVRILIATVGFPAARPGMLVELFGVGDLFSGNYVVEEITHQYTQNKPYTTTLILGRNALGNIRTATPFPVNLKQTTEKEFGGKKVFAEVVSDA